ncbi:hypothetical protein D0T11_18600 [Hymenobacter rubripertinctus]|uniref:Uncharacterized protein n=2 Tax=Hymenobacter rubripertinctus TaxID=2029981 RepID=A0A418QMT8_9BACT|nr:hypothetical protein D0T11_18600 [Hymenobacter rubripertinctus]
MAYAQGRWAVGNGHYVENTPLTFQLASSGGFNSVTLTADGVVIVQAPTINSFYWDSKAMNFEGMTFFGPTTWQLDNQGGPFVVYKKNNVYINIDFTYTGSAGNQVVQSFEDCIFINCSSLSAVHQAAFRECVLINSNFASVAHFRSGYIDASSSIKLMPTGLTSFRATASDVLSAQYAAEYVYDNSFANLPRIIIRSNIRGQVGIVGGALLSPADFALNYPDQFIDCINAEPFFNKPEKQDFTLRLESPHLSRAIGPKHLRYAASFYFGTEAAENETITGGGAGNTRLVGTADGQNVSLISASGLTRNAQAGLIVKPNSGGNFIGQIRSGRIRMGDVPIRLKAVRYAGGLNMNTDFPGTESGFQANQPEVFNNNVPKYTQPSAGSSGRNPNRLTYQMRWSTLPDPDAAADSDWQLNAVWLEFEWNQPPIWNNNPAVPKGNGSPDFDNLNPANTAVVALWVQMAVRVVNNYYR